MKVHKMIRLPAILALFALLIAGCYTSPKPNQNPATPPTGTTWEQVPEYKLAPGDVLELKFFNNERFNETVTVRPDGRITLQKIGEVMAAGMTPLQLDTLVTETYAKFLLSPEVTIFVRQFGGYQVYVLGEVTSPGAYPIQRRMTLLQAIAAAGGPRESAKLGSVMLLRRGQEEEIETLRVDLNKPIKGATAEVVQDNDLYVQVQDIVYVPKTFFASTRDFLRDLYAGVLPPLDVYLRALWWRDR